MEQQPGGSASRRRTGHHHRHARHAVPRHGARDQHTAKVDRRFFFVDDRYIIAADTLQAAAGQTPTFSWLLHGNGGGTSGGTYATTAAGGEWVHGAARLDAAVATDAGPVSFSTRETNHEGPGRQLLTHTALTASSTATGPTTHGLVVAYPTRSGESAPTVETLPPSGDGAAIQITDAAGDRIVVATHHPDGTVTIRDTHLDGTPRVTYSDATTKAGNQRGVKVSTRATGPLGVRVSPTSADILSRPQPLGARRAPAVHSRARRRRVPAPCARPAASSCSRAATVQ